MAVSADDQRRRHVIVEQRDGGGVGAVGNRQRTGGVAVVLGEGERRGGAKTDARQAFISYCRASDELINSRFSLYWLSKAHSWTTPVLVDEFDAGAFQGAAHREFVSCGK
jgi:hypothetical protein